MRGASSTLAASPDEGSTHWQSSKTDYFNPWKIEIGLSWDVKRLVSIKGLRFYANLLPEYRKSADLPKVRTMGLEIKLTSAAWHAF